ncbi:Cytochrome c family protein [Rhodovulum sp. P5]|uniref:Tll0287-like domain-containing protein n=1 Tax=Rhodovulum sp. P5 TaxID=1564506 RepID=UPI0009C22708|nr:DUF3365 domain-containing protein [Rhodovulum sp. P5]ARE40755.1 Cytochrome c family protein [Rhodovulum sp. P5]
MKTWVMPVAVALMLAGQAAAADDTDALVAEGKGLMRAFGAALKTELTAAVEAGGPVNAITVCNTEAPGIAKGLSKDRWTVARSSHRLRNPDNAPDAFTANAIAAFLSRQAAGEAPERLSTAAIVEEDGQRVFHLVKAIPTSDLCLGCHGGTTVKPEVEAKLAELYPDDKARGFSAGEMRGVFTLKKVLSE